MEHARESRSSICTPVRSGSERRGPCARRGESTFVQVDAWLQPARRSIVYSELRCDPAISLLAVFPEGRPAIGSILPQRIEVQLDLRQPGFVVVKVARNPLEGFEARFFRSHPMPHVFDNRVAPRDPDILLAATGRTRAANIRVDEKARANQRRITNAAGDLERASARCGHPRHLALRVDAHAVDRALWRTQGHVHRPRKGRL